MELTEGMIFSTTEEFMSNFFNSKTVKLTQVDKKSVRIEFTGSKGTAIYPKKLFYSLIARGVLHDGELSAAELELAEALALSEKDEETPEAIEYFEDHEEETPEAIEREESTETPSRLERHRA